ncbi:MAG: VanW family protein, partial [Vallitaleaceae bacterium]|nr:VanW family protein [Vallitaleaceae bacterium]
MEDIHIGGLSKAAALSLLQSTIDKRYKNKELKIFYEQTAAYKLPYDYFDFRTDYENLIEMAYGLAKVGTLKERFVQVEKMKEGTVRFSTKEWYDDGKVIRFVQELEPNYYVKAQDATFEKTEAGFVIHDEVVGKAINVEASVKAINEALVKGKSQVNLEVITTEPQITKTFYEDIKDLIGSYTTAFSSNQVGRNENLRVAASLIDKTLLLPGEVFSTNDTIGPTDAAHGYQEAPVIVNGLIQKGFGGGVCQVSTTLYNAVLLAELEIVERRNHSLAVAYIEKGRDATLADGSIDFKFKNNTNTPIYIESYLEDYHIHMNIYGKETNTANRSIDFETEVVDTIMPPPEKITEDPTLKPNEEVVEKKAIVGYTVKLYKLIYIDNALTDKIEINTSYYAA